MNRDHGMDDSGSKGTSDATFPGCEIEGDELEFLRAVDAYKIQRRKKFLTNLELLTILKGLGYRKEK